MSVDAVVVVDVVVDVVALVGNHCCLFCALLNYWDQSFVLTLLWWFGLFGSVYTDLIVLER